eukprot:TRINITY_DN1981_c0_g1_i1.p1 TRINITY_DN1981_c0_g1~~TRINITY_DN1981_c0_g1_i1.p1  ORF type:complete len:124 (-),score=23.34 TRINITY_DN1981_c0_g1_i1:23-394(-)
MKILIVEDNTLNQFHLVKLLEDMNCSVDISNNGQEAIEMYHNYTNGYDLIIMDCMMPILDGVEATKLIRQLENERQIRRTPIIALTGLDIGSLEVECTNAGVDICLSKPVSEEELKSVVSYLL